jgi:hypothetical protein
VIEPTGACYYVIGLPRKPLYPELIGVTPYSSYIIVRKFIEY